MAMELETFNIYLEALRTICLAYETDITITRETYYRFKVEFAGVTIKRPSRHYPLEDCADIYESKLPYMLFDLCGVHATICDLIACTRLYFEDTLHLVTTNDIDKIWEELLMKNFTKNNLMNGDFVIRRDGVKGVVIQHPVDTGIIVLQNGGYVPLDSYNTELNCLDSRPIPELDIMKVYRESKCFDLCDLCGTLVYDRELVEVEEMTLEQVCKALGKNIKIVKG